MTDEKETYLFAWNPERFDWTTLDDQIVTVRDSGVVDDTWSCGSVRSIPVGSRFFLIRLAQEPRGLVGSGVTVGDVQEAPHWDEQRAHSGETARRVAIQFDVLSRTPIMRRSELNAPPFDGVSWDTQMSGIKIPADVAASLEREWKSRLAQGNTGDAKVRLQQMDIDRWRLRWEQVRADATWVERHKVLDATRREVLPEIRALIVGFIDGGIPLATFRESFDHKTRDEWDLFGLKGLSGAMFLNKFVKYLPDHEDAATVLRAAVHAPESESDARSKLQDLLAYMERQIAAGATTVASLQPNRCPFFVSACWHVQRPERWPIVYQSAREALQSDGLLGRNLKGADGYLEFARVFRSVADAVGLSFWELEHLCSQGDIRPPEPSGSGIAEPDEEDSEHERVWLIAPGPGASMFDEFYEKGIVAIGWDYLTDLSGYEDMEAIRKAIQQNRGGDASPIHDAFACHQFVHDMKVGDLVFAKRGRKEIVGYGFVKSVYRYEPSRGSYVHVRSVDWKKKGQWTPRERPLVTKTLTDIAAHHELVNEIKAAIGIGSEAKPPVMPPPPARTPYTIGDALNEMFIKRTTLLEAIELLRYKKNLVLQGPPGVGKTYAAKRLAYLLLGEKDSERVELVQFHPSYSYEDFVQGYRPTDGGAFKRVDGPFLRFCDQAMQDPNLPYVLIVDEINRANLSKVFGELLMLIEADKRSDAWAASLIYGKEGEAKFHVPKNLHIIGTMNTADRSLAMVDYALRRRFAFIDLGPGFAQPSFAEHLNALGVDAVLRERIITRVERLNSRIREDSSLGNGFCVGHSYFCQTAGAAADGDWYKRIVRTEIGPLLREYWFDNQERADEELASLLDDD